MFKNGIVDKSFDFAVQIVELHKLLNDKKEYVLSKQLLRSGTSIGANVHEAQAAQSKKDFIAKMSISSKEARESFYWLKLLHTTHYISEEKFINLNSELEEIIKLLTSIIKSSQASLNKN